MKNQKLVYEIVSAMVKAIDKPVTVKIRKGFDDSCITAVLICLGYNKLYFELKLPNGSVGQLLDVMDYISNSFLMPFISLLTSILIGWVIGPDWIIGEVERNGEKFKRAGMYRFMIRYVVPVVMLVLFLVSTGFADLIA